MPTQEQVPEILKSVEQRLKQQAEHGGANLQVSESNLDDDWLYIVVTPVEVGVRASEHAELMSRIERELRDEGIENVLLVPTLSE